MLTIVLFVFAVNAFAQDGQAAPDKILGLYWSPKKDAKIEMYKKGDRYFGRTVWALHPRKDTENPDVRLRSRALVGLDLLTSFSFEEGIYTNGQVYDPESGKTYSCKISFSGSNIKVRGYVGFSLFGRTELFERIP
ncbi:DUF2147 domain-containing protein [Flaviaesturariibacter flavus]|uniref:DUF2147 domain-containing protein n=1 Tax=Flaviaesturariibacter flavus TaxID=2502780 RepID=A0A4R1B2C0_9BACT|nr:DUF2147 domain-containing protein [Flaviaesturariibacter flavus]